MRTKINQLKKQLKNERGLTLVELLAVIVILAIIAVIAFVMIGNVTENAKKDAHISNAQQLIAAAKLYDATEKSIEGDSVDSDKLYDAEFLDQLINPWDAEDGSYKGTVSKEGAKFTVKITGNDKIKCDLNTSDEIDEKYLAQDREKVCGD
ncbi:MAG TPA: prepilin-type N-terminal cleavage/methylation domain-containing protein [Bacillota bacterium]|nr:prepilin-type N-terminal cleavage/methylation domain-containing protein [Bacillota bacterium]